MIKKKNFCIKSLDEIRRVLADMGLEFGQAVDSFQERYQEWLKRKDADEA